MVLPPVLFSPRSLKVLPSPGEVIPGIPLTRRPLAQSLEVLKRYEDWPLSSEYRGLAISCTALCEMPDEAWPIDLYLYNLVLHGLTRCLITEECEVTL